MKPAPLVVVVGMVREARIVKGPGVTVVVGGGQSARLAADLDDVIANGAVGVVSFGLCGGLDPLLNAGDLLIASSAPSWLSNLRSMLPRARRGHVVGADVMIDSKAQKARLRLETGADAVDMETHLAIDVARRAALPWAVIRSVSDPAQRALPRAALAGMKADGEANVSGVIGALARRPWELPALLRTAREAARAFEALEAARGVLGRTLGCPDLADAYSAGSR